MHFTNSVSVLITALATLGASAPFGSPGWQSEADEALAKRSGSPGWQSEADEALAKRFGSPRWQSEADEAA